MNFEAHAPNEAEATRQALSSLSATGYEVRRIHVDNPRLCKVTGHGWDCWAYTVHVEGEQLTEAELRTLDGNR